MDYLARSNKFLELMDNAEKAIEKVNADQIYTSKQFMRIRDEFYVSRLLWPSYEEMYTTSNNNGSFDTHKEKLEIQFENIESETKI